MGGFPGQHKEFTFQYDVTLENGVTKSFTMRLDGDTLSLVNIPRDHPPEWTKLGFSKCLNCPLTKEPHCPIAVNLSAVIDEFEDTKSFTHAKVTVTSPDRGYFKDTSVQSALSGITGIIMVASGCPIMDQLRPNVAFHLPFASALESSYRSISMYLIAQAIKKMKGEEPDWEMAGLTKIYEEVALVNKGMANRVKEASTTDSGANAIVILNAFGDSVSLMLDSNLEELESYFKTLTGKSEEPEKS